MGRRKKNTVFKVKPHALYCKVKCICKKDNRFIPVCIFLQKGNKRRATGTHLGNPFLLCLLFALTHLL
jgi:hypothetical protein